MKITRVGLDIATQVFQVHGVDERGKAGVRKQLPRAKVLQFFVQLPPCLVGIESWPHEVFGWPISSSSRVDPRYTRVSISGRFTPPSW